jgi:3-phenylpropionate/trans-cinnamate dioxygenase ferredoxin subunit
MNTAGDRGAFAAVGRLTDVPPGALLSARLPSGEQVVVMNVDGEICALRDCCSHEEFALSAGEILPDGTIECVWHGARFDCRTGAVRHPPAVVDVASYDVAVDGDMIMVGPPRGRR